jgi:hypothetical protein
MRSESYVFYVRLGIYACADLIRYEGQANGVLKSAVRPCAYPRPTR